MQNFIDIPSTDSLQNSRLKLINNDKSIMSCHSGKAFPANNLEIGMQCLRTDLNQLFELKDLTPSWVLIADLNKTYTNKEYVDEKIDNHGIHLPAKETANNKKFLRNDNSWQEVTPANIGAALATHTHTSAQVSDATNANTANMIVKRDASGNFAAGTITAALKGNSTTSDKWKAEKKITLQGIIEGSVSIDGSKDLTMTTKFSGNAGNNTCVESGLELSGGRDGLNLAVSKGRAIVNGNVVEVPNDKTLALDARMTSLVYLKSDASIDKKNAEFPVADANTVARWDLSAGNLNDSSGNNNHLICYGNNAVMIPDEYSKYWKWVDGYRGYGLEMDGVTSNTYLVSTNGGSFPTGAQEREIRCIFTCTAKPSSRSVLFATGIQATAQTFVAHTDSNNKVRVDFHDGEWDTGYILSTSETYFFVLNYDGRIARLYINGIEVWQKTFNLKTSSSGVFHIGRWIGSNYVSPGIWHYAEFKNKITQPDKIAEITNKALFSISYNKPTPSYPSYNETSSIELRFDEASGTTVADTMKTRNGEIVGTVPIVVADNNLGNARQFNANAANYVSLPGSYTLSQNMTVITVLKREKDNYGRIFGSIGNDGMIFSTGQDNSQNPAWYNGSTWYQSSVRFTSNKVSFLAYVLNPTSVTFYVDSKIPDVVPATVNVRTPANLSIGRVWDGNHPFAGNIYYFLLVPRSLSQAEIAQYYDKLMASQARNLQDDISLNNSLMLGLAQTSATKVINHTLAGNINAAKNFLNIPNSFSLNSCVKLENGLTLQWGITNPSGRTIFPLAFKNGVLALSVDYAANCESGIGGNGNKGGYISKQSITNSGADIYFRWPAYTHDNSTGQWQNVWAQSATYIVIGY